MPDKKGKQKYKTIRIYPEDQETLKRLAFYNNTTIVKLVSESLELLEEKYSKKAKAN